MQDTKSIEILRDNKILLDKMQSIYRKRDAGKLLNTNTIENAIDSSAYQTQKKVARKSTLIYRKIEKDKIHAENQKMLTRL